MLDLKFEISNLKLLAESCSGQLRAWADSLQNSEIKDQRHLNAKERREFAATQRTEALRKKLLQNLPANHPLRRHD